MNISADKYVIITSRNKQVKQIKLLPEVTKYHFNQQRSDYFQENQNKELHQKRNEDSI